MNARPGRPPKQPTGNVTTLTLRVPPQVKQYLIDTTNNLDMSITEYIITLIQRDAAEDI